MTVGKQGDLPVWWEEQKVWIMHETEHWFVCVVPMMFNDRICLATKAELGRTWTAGFCYQDRPMASVAALAWNPETEQYPRHFFKIAHDGRDVSYSDRTSTQLLCLFCRNDLHRGREDKLVRAHPESGWGFMAGGDACCVCGVTGRPSEWIMADTLGMAVRYPLRVPEF